LGGWWDDFVNGLTNLMLAIPSLIFALAIMAVLGPGLTSLLIALGLTNWSFTCRIARASTLSLKSQGYVQAARVLGYGDLRIMITQLLPNMLGPIIVIGTLAWAARYWPKPHCRSLASESAHPIQAGAACCRRPATSAPVYANPDRRHSRSAAPRTARDDKGRASQSAKSARRMCASVRAVVTPKPCVIASLGHRLKRVPTDTRSGAGELTRLPAGRWPRPKAAEGLNAGSDE